MRAYQWQTPSPVAGSLTMAVGEITLLGVFLTCVEILGILTAVHAVLHVRTSQGAIAWLFALILFAPVTLPLYWVFGRDKFKGYLQPRREGDTEVHQRVAEKFDEYRQKFGVRLDGAAGRFEVCEELARLPFLTGNKVELLIDGQQTFDAIFEGIDSAKEYVFVEYFIIHEDHLGHEFQKRLVSKARAGVRVLLLYDEVGTHRLSRKYRQELTDAGVGVRRFFSTRGWQNRFQLNFRNHRKIVVVDGKRAFVGGLNVGDEYMGRSKRFGPWRDTHLELTGPAVACVQLAFAEDWYWSTSGAHVRGNWEVERCIESAQDVLVLPTGPADTLASCGLFFTHAIHAAQRRIWIASPYFVPDESVIVALKLAALRGVDVRILLPDEADHLLVYWSSFSFIAEAEPVGVKFYRYEPGFLHQKVVLVDDDFAAVGTANLDNRSFRLNFEITIAVADTGFAGEVEKMLSDDFDRSRQVTADEFHRRPIWFRFAVKASRLMAPIQ
jgi:cardiolipin synthase